MKKAKLTPSEQITLKFYETSGDQWAKEHSVANRWDDYFVLLNNNLPKGKLLEIGSGGGRDAKRLISLGYDYTGTDISKKLLKIVQEANPTGKFFHQSVYDLDFPKDSFDGFWACAVLLHIPKSRIDEALQKIKQVIKNKGVGFISLKQGEGEKVINEEFESGFKFKRFFSYYQYDEFKEVLTRNGFKILESEIKNANEKTTWLLYLVKVVK